MTAEISSLSLFFFNDTATTEIYTLSLHDALPISDVIVDLDDLKPVNEQQGEQRAKCEQHSLNDDPFKDRKSTRLNSSHANISYAVFCLKKKTTHANRPYTVGRSQKK